MGLFLPLDREIDRRLPSLIQDPLQPTQPRKPRSKRDDQRQMQHVHRDAQQVQLAHHEHEDEVIEISCNHKTP